MTATIVILAALSPLLVALVRRCAWPAPVVELASLAIVAALFVLGQWLDARLAWPLGPDFWTELAAAWGIQQAAYKFVFRGNATTTTLEAVGDPPAPAPLAPAPAPPPTLDDAP